MGILEWMFGKKSPSVVMDQAEAMSTRSGSAVSRPSQASRPVAIIPPMKNRPAESEKGAPGVVPGIGGSVSGSGGGGGWYPLGSHLANRGQDQALATTFDGNARLANPIWNLATDVAKVRLRLKRRKGPDPRRDPEVFEHDFLTLWNKPHPMITRIQWIRLVICFLKTTGKAPVHFKGRKGKYVRGRHVFPPTILEIIPPHFVQNYPNEIKPVWGVQWWGRSLVEIAIKDVMFLNEPALTDPYSPGIGHAKSIDEDVSQDVSMGAFNSVYFRNMAFLGALVNIPGCDPEVEAKKFEEKEGIQNAGRTMVTNAENVTVSNLSPLIKDLNFVEGQNSKRDFINQRFSQSNERQGNFSNAGMSDLEAADFHQQHNCVTPELIYLSEAINQFLLPEFGEADLYCEFVDPVRETAERKLAETDTLVARGLMTINEGRSRHDLPEKPGLDCLTIPTNNVLLVPIDQVEEYVSFIRNLAASKITNPNNQNEPKSEPKNEPKPPMDPRVVSIPEADPEPNGKPKSKSLSNADLDAKLDEMKQAMMASNGAQN